MEQEKIDLLNAKIADWKLVGNEIPAKIAGKERSEPALVYIKYYTAGQRKLRLLKSISIWWGLALISVFIPIAHFFLVPLFMLAGTFAPFFAYRKHSIVLGGKGLCPYCSQAFEVAGNADRWPLQDICNSCHRHVKIKKYRPEDSNH